MAKSQTASGTSSPVDVAVIGGGLVGAAIGFGLARRGRRTMILDEGDIALRASRGNFGLVWVQGKGLGLPAYARWTRHSAGLWPGLAAELSEIADIDVHLEQRGGVWICLSEEELAETGGRLQRLADAGDGPGYEFEVLDNAKLATRISGLGPTIPGGTYTPYDGHVNPLRTLWALHVGHQRLGGRYLPNAKVAAVTGGGAEGFMINSAAGIVEAEKVVLAAGLGAPLLAAQLGLEIDVKPVHGQVLIAERMPRILDIPTNILRQTDEGTLQIGYTTANLGYSSDTRMTDLHDLAIKAVRVLPTLADRRIVRTWGALRIVSRDGFPIYQQSSSHPGAFLFTCHSGVTLGAVHALEVPDWVAGNGIPAEFDAFSPRRFHVQAA